MIEASARVKWIATLLLLCVPALQLSLGPAWMYTPPSIDAWVYHGYFLHLEDHAISFNGTYYGSRLAWILPGYLAHHFFSPLIANAILRLFLYWMSALSTFFLIGRWYGWRCGLVTSLLLSSYGGFLNAIGWDYVDGAGIAYSLLCLEELSAGAIGVGWVKWRCFVAGVAFAAAVHSNITLLCFAPVLAVFFLVRTGWRGMVMAIPAISGFVTLTAFLGYISVRLGGPFRFFWPSLLMAAGLGQKNPWFVSGLKWTIFAWWLIVPCVCGLLGISLTIRLVRRWLSGRQEPDDAIRIGDAAAYLLALAMFVTFTASGDPVLQLTYYASYLTIFAVVVVGAFIGRRLEELANFWGLAAGCVLLSLVVGGGLVHKLPFVYTPALHWFTLNGATSEIGFGLAFGVGIVWADWIKRPALSATLAAAMMVHVGLVALLVRPGAREFYADVSRTSRELGELTASKTLWFWYDQAADFDGRFQAISSTYLWGYRLLGARLPDTQDFHFELAHPGNEVAVMDRRPSALTDALRNLERGGWTLKPIRKLTSPTGAADYVLELVEVAEQSQ